jgi:hypothetical protein
MDSSQMYGGRRTLKGICFHGEIEVGWKGSCKQERSGLFMLTFLRERRKEKAE